MPFALNLDSRTRNTDILSQKNQGSTTHEVTPSRSVRWVKGGGCNVGNTSRFHVESDHDGRARFCECDVYLTSHRAAGPAHPSTLQKVVKTFKCRRPRSSERITPPT